ncbi:Protein kinase domain [Dillenia turbinata]|uniref:non-specific serine/threonine protein kinase n=1 Tax=Dillenia turbinata TaxID=194707 RepID=A0AAN8VRR2_9MAGN
MFLQRLFGRKIGEERGHTDAEICTWKIVKAYARDLKSGQSVVIKIVNKEKVLCVGLIDQIKREISVMRLVRHPNVVQLYEVMATKTNIYFTMEYAKGGELFNKVAKGKRKDDLARKYFQQLIGAVDFCHSRGVYHHDLKPENLLLDEDENLKVLDFGLSALSESRRQDGYLSFHDQNLMEMYRKISRGEFKCPQWFQHEVRKLVSKILDPNPYFRITMCHEDEDNDVDELGDIFTACASDSEGITTLQPLKGHSMKTTCFNAFDIISHSQGFNLSGLFDEYMVLKPEE